MNDSCDKVFRANIRNVKLKIICKVIGKRRKIVFASLLKDRTMNVFQLFGREPCEAEATMLQLSDEIKKLVQSVVEMANDRVPDGDMVIEVLVVTLLSLEDMESCVNSFVEIFQKLVMLVVHVKKKVHVLEQWKRIELSLIVGPKISADNCTDDGSSGESDEIGDDSFLSGVLSLGFRMLWKHFRDVAELSL